MIKTQCLLGLFILLLFSSLQSQTLEKEDSLILFQQSESFMLSKPFAQYSIEIRSDRTISFSGFVPKNFPKYHENIVSKCNIDSNKIILDSIDYFTFEQAILSVNLENPNSHLKKEIVENGIRAMSMGSYSKTYTFNTSQHSNNYSLGNVMERDLSIEFARLIKLIQAFETKYRPSCN